MNIDGELIKKAKKCVYYLKNEKKKLAIAESCTGGLLSFVISTIPGASTVFECSVVTYSNDSKELFLSVKKNVLTYCGAVSMETAEAMVNGLIDLVPCADVALSITGFAGRNTTKAPSLQEDTKAGLVFVACAQRRLRTKVTEFQFCKHLTRFEIQQKAAESAIDTLLTTITQENAT